MSSRVRRARAREIVRERVAGDAQERKGASCEARSRRDEEPGPDAVRKADEGLSRPVADQGRHRRDDDDDKENGPPRGRFADVVGPGGELCERAKRTRESGSSCSPRRQVVESEGGAGRTLCDALGPDDPERAEEEDVEAEHADDDGLAAPAQASIPREGRLGVLDGALVQPADSVHGSRGDKKAVPRCRARSRTQEWGPRRGG